MDQREAQGIIRPFEAVRWHTEEERRAKVAALEAAGREIVQVMIQEMLERPRVLDASCMVLRQRGWVRSYLAAAVAR